MLGSGSYDNWHTRLLGLLCFLAILRRLNASVPRCTRLLSARCVTYILFVSYRKGCVQKSWKQTPHLRSSSFDLRHSTEGSSAARQTPTSSVTRASPLYCRCRATEATEGLYGILLAYAGHGRVLPYSVCTVGTLYLLAWCTVAWGAR